MTLFLLMPFLRLYTQGVNDINYIDYNLALLFVAIALLTAMRLPMLKTIHYAGHFKLTTPQTLIETGLNLSVSLIGVFFFGIYGVLLGTVVALLYRTNDIIIYSNMKLLKRSPLKTYSIYVLNIAMLLLSQLVFNGIFSCWDIFSYLDFICIGSIAIIIAIVMFMGVQYIVFPNNREITKQILTSNKRRK